NPECPRKNQADGSADLGDANKAEERSGQRDRALLHRLDRKDELQAACKGEQCRQQPLDDPEHRVGSHRDISFCSLVEWRLSISTPRLTGNSDLGGGSMPTRRSSPMARERRRVDFDWPRSTIR